MSKPAVYYSFEQIERVAFGVDVECAEALHVWFEEFDEVCDAVASSAGIFMDVNV